MLLKVGRHLRPASHYKIIVSREEGENHYLSGYRNEFISLEATSHNGPIALIDGVPGEKDIELAASIVARYSQGRDADQVQVEVRMQDGSLRELNVKPLAPGDIVSAWHV
jgi:predicted ribosome quality control (RQC) complex YloA/Tae2 family protein